MGFVKNLEVLPVAQGDFPLLDAFSRIAGLEETAEHGGPTVGTAGLNQHQGKEQAQGDSAVPGGAKASRAVSLWPTHGPNHPPSKSRAAHSIYPPHGQEENGIVGPFRRS